MKWIKRILPVGVLSAACLFLLSSGTVTQSAEQENHCFTCHTNARKLIQITREIAKSREGEPKATVESEGEG